MKLGVRFWDFYFIVRSISEQNSIRLNETDFWLNDIYKHKINVNAEQN